MAYGIGTFEGRILAGGRRGGWCAVWQRPAAAVAGPGSGLAGLLAALRATTADRRSAAVAEACESRGPWLAAEAWPVDRAEAARQRDLRLRAALQQGLTRPVESEGTGQQRSRAEGVR